MSRNIVTKKLQQRQTLQQRQINRFLRLDLLHLKQEQDKLQNLVALQTRVMQTMYADIDDLHSQILSLTESMVKISTSPAGLPVENYQSFMTKTSCDKHVKGIIIC